MDQVERGFQHVADDGGMNTWDYPSGGLVFKIKSKQRGRSLIGQDPTMM